VPNKNPIIISLRIFVLLDMPSASYRVYAVGYLLAKCGARKLLPAGEVIEGWIRDNRLAIEGRGKHRSACYTTSGRSLATEVRILIGGVGPLEGSNGLSLLGALQTRMLLLPLGVCLVVHAAVEVVAMRDER